MKISVLGSCISRVSLLYGIQDLYGIYQGEKLGLELEYFLDKHNPALAMLPAPFSREEVDTITEEQLTDKTRVKSLRQQLMKETVPLLLDGESEYLIVDFYDFHNYVFSYKDTAFGTQANEFCGTALGKKYKEELQAWNLFQLPTWVLYGMVDRFFDTIMQKFDADHIILNRFWTNAMMLYKDGTVGLIPEECKQPFQCHEKYNVNCFNLEQHIIDKYHPYVIDLSRYFIGDANIWDNWNASHFEREFYRETYDQIIRIITKQADEKYFDKVRFFDSARPGYQEDKERKFDVEWGIQLFEQFVENNNDLWKNMLDKLLVYAPEDSRVKQYCEIIFG